MQAAAARHDRAHSGGARVLREGITGASEWWARFRHLEQEADIQAAGLGRRGAGCHLGCCGRVPRRLETHQQLFLLCVFLHLLLHALLPLLPGQFLNLVLHLQQTWRRTAGTMAFPSLTALSDLGLSTHEISIAQRSCQYLRSRVSIGCSS